MALALNALVWTISEPERGDRLLALTGLAPDDLRSRLTDPTLLAAAIGFLEANEADLTACAEALKVAPGALVKAREALER